MMDDERLSPFIKGKPEHSVALLNHFLTEYKRITNTDLYVAKSMIGIVANGKKVAWVTQIGKAFIHVVFPFNKAYTGNLCFLKIAEVPGGTGQFNHHLRILHTDDINDEVKGFMKLAARA